MSEDGVAFVAGLLDAERLRRGTRTAAALSRPTIKR